MVLANYRAIPGMVLNLIFRLTQHFIDRSVLAFLIQTCNIKEPLPPILSMSLKLWGRGFMVTIIGTCSLLIRLSFTLLLREQTMQHKISEFQYMLGSVLSLAAFCLEESSDSSHTTTLVPFVKGILKCSDLLNCEVPTFERLPDPIREDLRNCVRKRLLEQQLDLVSKEPRKLDDHTLRRNVLEGAIKHGDEETILRLLRMVTAPRLGIFSTLTTEDAEASRLEIPGSGQERGPYRLTRTRALGSSECLLLEELEADMSNRIPLAVDGYQEPLPARAQTVCKLWLVRGHGSIYLELQKSSSCSSILEIEVSSDLRPRVLAKILDLAKGLQLHSPISHPIWLDGRSLLELAAHRAQAQCVQLLAWNLGLATAIPVTSLSTIDLASANDITLASQKSALKSSGMVGRKGALLHNVRPGQVKLAPGIFGDLLTPVDTAKWCGYGICGRLAFEKTCTKGNSHQAGIQT